MATEKTPLVSACVVDIPRDKDKYEILIGNEKTKSLSLEELMPFQDDPWWHNVRRTFFYSFWLTVIMIFLSACILSILQHGSCDNLKTIVPTPVISSSTIAILSEVQA